MGPVGPIGGPRSGTRVRHRPRAGPGWDDARPSVVAATCSSACSVPSGVTFVMALFVGTIMFWVLHLLADVLLGGYVYLLLQHKARASGGVERRPMPARPGPVVPALPNVHDLTARRFPPATAPSHVEAPREATVLALRRTASW